MLRHPERRRARDGTGVGQGERAQSTVEFALVLPVVIVLFSAVLQVGLIARDRVRAVHTTRAVARAVITDPTAGAAQAALEQHGPAGATVSLTGSLRPGGRAVVVVSLPVTRLPLVGGVLGGARVSDRLVVLVEGPR